MNECKLLNTVNKDWLECAKWLNELHCLPAHLEQKLKCNTLSLSEFANSLRDGELLCDLANQLCDGCIDSSLVNRRAQMSQLLSLNNIRLFLQACKSPALFNLTESDLFDEHMLYELLDLACVIRTLSIVSMSKPAQNKKIRSFQISQPPQNSQNQQQSGGSGNARAVSSAGGRKPEFNNLTKMNKLSLTDLSDDATTTSGDANSIVDHSDDIYYNIVPNELQPEQPESYYTDESWIMHGLQMHQKETEVLGLGANDAVYIAIVNPGSDESQQHQPTKRDYVVKEIVDTEKNFLDGLYTLMNDFLRPLSTVLKSDDYKTICVNIDELIRVHESLFNELVEAIKGKQGRSERICKVFETYKVRLMTEYAVYFSNIDKSIAKCDSMAQVSLNSASNESEKYKAKYRDKLKECKDKSKRGNFNVTDLLRLPYQRVLKYHLLFKEFHKQIGVEHSSREVIKQTADSMHELGNYLNEVQRDKENLSKIDQVIQHLRFSNSATDSTGHLHQLIGKNQHHSPIISKEYGHYIKDGKFRIKSIDTNEMIARTRSFFLFEKALIICKAKNNYYSYKETFLLSDYNIEESLSSGFMSSSVDSSSSTSTHSFYLSNPASGKYNLVLFKNREEKKIWKEALVNAKRKSKPEGHSIQKHSFELTNFDKNLTQCFVCSKYLLGIFFQGYQCVKCSSIVHKDCLARIKLACQGLAKSSSTDMQQIKHINRSSSTISTNSNGRQSGNNGLSTPQVARAINTYTGRPGPPEPPALLFQQNDLIQITDDDDDLWCKGFLLNNVTKSEGYFPRSYVKLVPANGSVNRGTNNSIAATTPTTPSSHHSGLNEYAWFAPVDRTTAEVILARVPNDLAQTIFMVRCKQEGGYAISIKYNGSIEHIKINMLNLNNTTTNEVTTAFSIDQQHSFDSIQSLVNYYSKNDLKDNFPQLETTLGMAYRRALPVAISLGIAQHDYNPSSSPNNTGELIELRKGARYFVLAKENKGWWRVYNSDGLIGYAPGAYLEETKLVPPPASLSTDT